MTNIAAFEFEIFLHSTESTQCRNHSDKSVISGEMRKLINKQYPSHSSDNLAPTTTREKLGGKSKGRPQILLSWVEIRGVKKGLEC